MLHLKPMEEIDYAPFMDLSLRDQAEGHVREGRWTAEEAEAKMLKLQAQFLPQGLKTPGHFFFTLESETPREKVGSLWFMLDEHEGEKALFVMDIQIDPQHRRKGYGTEAFLLMEDKAREMGIHLITLHVFSDNTSAHAMYVKLGYNGPCDLMVKRI